MATAHTRNGADLELIRSVALAANAARDPDEVLRVGIDAVCEYLGWPLGIVWRPDDASGRWMPVWHYAAPQLDAHRLGELLARGASPDAVLRALLHAPATASAWALAELDDVVSRSAHGLGLEAALAFTVRVRDVAVAAIQCFSHDGTGPDRSSIATMETICVQVGHVFERDLAVRSLHDQLFRAGPLGSVVDASDRELSDALPRAIERQEIELVYQPVVSLEDGRLVSMEALLRWRREHGEVLDPSSFVPLAERLGLIDDLGDLALRTACREFADWRARYPRAPRTIAVNVSPLQLREGFAGRVRAVLARYGLRPSSLVLEITETALSRHEEQAARHLRELERVGVNLVIDDFGVGESSLGRLRRFPVGGIKLDRSFLSDIAAGEDPPILGGAFALARELGLTVVAEGVETPAQLELLLGHGCDEAQGFLFSRPLSSQQVARLLDDPGWEPPGT